MRSWRFSRRRRVSSPLLGGEPLAFAPVDALLAHPVADGLLDEVELSRDVGDGAVLVDHEGRHVAAELSWVPTSPTPSGLLLGH
jgi:hypothetical protein